MVVHCEHARREMEGGMLMILQVLRIDSLINATMTQKAHEP